MRFSTSPQVQEIGDCGSTDIENYRYLKETDINNP